MKTETQTFICPTISSYQRKSVHEILNHDGMIHCVDFDLYILYCLPDIFTHEMTPNEYLTRDNIIVPRVWGEL
jgi:hypothetical protein